MNRVNFPAGHEVYPSDDLGSGDGLPAQNSAKYSIQDVLESELENRGRSISSGGVAEGMTLTGGIDKLTVGVGYAYDMSSRYFAVATPTDVAIKIGDDGKYLVAEASATYTSPGTVYGRTAFKRLLRSPPTFSVVATPSENQIKLARILSVNPLSSPTISINPKDRDLFHAYQHEPIVTVALDGTADFIDIQSAIDQIAAYGGGTVIISSGTYTITSALVIPSANIHLMGSGPAAVINMNATTESALVITNSGDATSPYAPGVRVSNLLFKFALAQTVSSNLIVMAGVSNVRISNCVFQGFTQVNSIGVNIGDHCMDVQIVGCNFFNLLKGVLITGGASNLLSRVVGGTAKDCVTGVGMTGGPQLCSVSGMLIARSDGTGYGVDSDASAGCVKSCVIQQVGIGVRIQVNSLYGFKHRVTGNVILSSGTYAVQMGAGTTQNIVDGNVLTLSGTGAVQDSGAANVVTAENITS